MHARELVEFAALLASNGRVIIGHAARLSDSGLEQYWSASRCRHECWSRSLKSFSHDLQFVAAKEMTARWAEIRHVLEEILTTEVLTRIWAAVCCSYERRRGLEEASPLVRNVFASHLEARNRALNLMVYGHGLRVEEAVTLNRMRRRNERWNDMLLGYLPEAADLSEFAFSATRVKEFADDARSSKRPETAWSLLLASLRMAYQRHTCPISPNEDLNQRVAAGILACLPGELFESTGTIKSLWLLRMQHAASDTQGMIDQLIALEDTPVEDSVWEARITHVPRHALAAFLGSLTSVRSGLPRLESTNLATRLNFGVCPVADVHLSDAGPSKEVNDPHDGVDDINRHGVLPARRVSVPPGSECHPWFSTCIGRKSRKTQVLLGSLAQHP